MLKDKKILVLSSITTYPIRSWWQARSHHIIREIAKHNTVRVFVPIARKDDLPRLRSFEVDCGNYTEIRSINYFLHTLTYICEKLWLFWVSFILFWFILRNNSRIKEEIQQADVVILNFPHLWFLLQKSDKDIYYISHNVEYELIQSNMKIQNWFVRQLITSLVKKSEIHLIAMSKKTFACTKKDIDIYQHDTWMDHSYFCLLENGVDREKIHDVDIMPESYVWKTHKIVFTGSYFTPNLEAVSIIEWLATYYPEFHFFIVWSVARWKQSHENISYVPDTSPRTCNTYIRYADYAINPVISWGGSNLKMIDYFYFWVPVIASKKGIRWFETYSNMLFDENNLDSLGEVIIDIDNNRESYINTGKNLAKSYFWDDLVSNKVLNETT